MWHCELHLSVCFSSFRHRYLLLYIDVPNKPVTEPQCSHYVWQLWYAGGSSSSTAVSWKVMIWRKTSTSCSVTGGISNVLKAYFVFTLWSSWVRGRLVLHLTVRLLMKFHYIEQHAACFIMSDKMLSRDLGLIPICSHALCKAGYGVWWLLNYGDCTSCIFYLLFLALWGEKSQFALADLTHEDFPSLFSVFLGLLNWFSFLYVVLLRLWPSSDGI